MSVLSALNIWLEAVEMLPNVTDEERERARKILQSAGLSLDRVERGGVKYAIRKAIKIIEEDPESAKDEKTESL